MGKKNAGMVGWIKRLPYSKKIAPYLFLLPFIVTFLVFNCHPIFSSLIMSFQKIKGFGSTNFVGLDNYRKLNNESFYASLKTTSLVTLFCCLFLIVIPLIIALFLNNKRIKGKDFCRAIFFIPALASTIVAGIVFRMLFAETETAAVNSILHAFGIPAQHFMLNYNWSIVLMVVLKYQCQQLKG